MVVVVVSGVTVNVKDCETRIVVVTGPNNVNVVVDCPPEQTG